MALYEKRIQAILLRKEGESIKNIGKILNISKSSASIWCREVQITEKQRNELMNGRNLKSLKGRLIGAEMNKQKRIRAIEDGYIFGKQQIQKLNNRELIIAGTALYWAEGSKSDLTFGFQFINSDPDMIICMRRFLSLLGIEDMDVACKVQINEMHKPRIELVLKFWKDLLDLRDEQLAAPSFVKTTTKKVYENYNTYYGICRLIVRKSAMLKYKMLGLIKALKEDILSG